MFIMNFAPEPTTLEQEEFLHDMYETHLRFQSENDYYSTDRVYKEGFREGGGLAARAWYTSWPSGVSDSMFRLTREWW